jgi:hypothetical protein
LAWRWGRRGGWWPVGRVAEWATGPDLAERAELIGAACPTPTAPGSSRNWTRR